MVQMIQVGKAIVSTEIIDRKFCCDLEKCKGICCVEGDSGAPLEDEETDILEEIFPVVKKYLDKVSLKAIDEQGLWMIDSDGDKVTPLVGKEQCAYVIYEKDIAKCAIEKAYNEGKIKFRKPISCYLYPIRITKHSDFEAVNYHRWDKCKPAEKEGAAKDVPTYVFLQKPLEAKYGKKWLKEFNRAAKMFIEQKNK